MSIPPNRVPTAARAAQSGLPYEKQRSIPSLLPGQANLEYVAIDVDGVAATPDAPVAQAGDAERPLMGEAVVEPRLGAVANEAQVARADARVPIEARAQVPAEVRGELAREPYLGDVADQCASPARPHDQVMRHHEVEVARRRRGRELEPRGWREDGRGVGPRQQERPCAKRPGEDLREPAREPGERRGALREQAAVASAVQIRHRGRAVTVEELLAHGHVHRVALRGPERVPELRGDLEAVAGVIAAEVEEVRVDAVLQCAARRDGLGEEARHPRLEDLRLAPPQEEAEAGDGERIARVGRPRGPHGPHALAELIAQVDEAVASVCKPAARVRS